MLLYSNYIKYQIQYHLMKRLAIYSGIAAIGLAQRQLTENEEEFISQTVLIIGLVLCGLIGFIYYDRSQGYRYINYVRHEIGERIRKAKIERKKKAQKQQRIETQEVLPTPKTRVQVDHQRTFIENQPTQILQESLCDSRSEPLTQEELQSDRQNRELKGVFEKKSSTHIHKKEKKQKKSKSKLKNRLQNKTNEQGEFSQQQQNSIAEQNSIVDNNSPVKQQQK